MGVTHLLLGQKLTGRPADSGWCSASLSQAWHRLHLCRYWQQQDPTELPVTAPQEAASQAGGHLGQTPSHLEPPLLAEPLTMAQAMEQIPAVLRVLPPGQAGTLCPVPWPAPFSCLLSWAGAEVQRAMGGP